MNDVATVVVARHGERLDYQMRDAGENWTASAERPWDPPLTSHGQKQAQLLGRHLHKVLLQMQAPKISKVYASPFLRCRQTAAGVVRGRDSMRRSEASLGYYSVEPGLAESLNESWYRSWALPGADGTWGYKVDGKPEYDPATLHPAASKPVQDLLSIPEDDPMRKDTPPHTNITIPYTFEPRNLESRADQRHRMKETLDTLAETGSTIVLVSHGGPVTHLYEELTGNPWQRHGESSYCCYSIYQREEGQWTALRVNQAEYLNEKIQYERHVSSDD